MSIRVKLYTAIVVVIAGLVLTAGVGIAAMSRLGDRFDAVQRAADARALALQLKFDVTDFNGWQTAYGYDDGKSRPTYLASFEKFRRDFALARAQLRLARETKLLDRIERATDDFARLDAGSWAALQAGRPEEVKRILLGPELVNFRRAAAAAEALAGFEAAQAAAQDESFKDARSDALRLLVLRASSPGCSCSFSCSLLPISPGVQRAGSGARPRRPTARASSHQPNWWWIAIRVASTASAIAITSAARGSAHHHPATDASTSATSVTAASAAAAIVSTASPRSARLSSAAATSNFLRPSQGDTISASAARTTPTGGSSTCDGSVSALTALNPM